MQGLGIGNIEVSYDNDRNGGDIKIKNNNKLALLLVEREGRVKNFIFFPYDTKIVVLRVIFFRGLSLTPHKDID